MKKKVVFTSCVILFILCLCFAAIYGFMLAYCNNTEDYSEKILGSWNCVQYYANGQVTTCKENSAATLEVTEDTFSLQCQDSFPSVLVNYTGLNGKILKAEVGTETYTIFFEFNTRGQLKVTIKEINVVFLMEQQH